MNFFYGPQCAPMSCSVIFLSITSVMTCKLQCNIRPTGKCIQDVVHAVKSFTLSITGAHSVISVSGISPSFPTHQHCSLLGYTFINYYAIQSVVMSAYVVNVEDWSYKCVVTQMNISVGSFYYSVLR